jgi:hypothetical protein
MLITNTKIATTMVVFRPNLPFVKVKRSSTYITAETLPRSRLLISSSMADYPLQAEKGAEGIVITERRFQHWQSLRQQVS